MKTAVDMLISRLPNIDWSDPYYSDIMNEAIHQEKEQIIQAWIATDNELQRIAAEQYYKETFKSE